MLNLVVRKEIARLWKVKSRQTNLLQPSLSGTHILQTHCALDSRFPFLPLTACL